MSRIYITKIEVRNRGSIGKFQTLCQLITATSAKEACDKFFELVQPYNETRGVEARPEDGFTTKIDAVVWSRTPIQR